MASAVVVDGGALRAGGASGGGGVLVAAAAQRVRPAGTRSADSPGPLRAGAGSRDSAESLPAEMTSADAFVAMANLALAAPQEAVPPVPEVIVVDRLTLSGASDEGRCHIDGAVAIPPETGRRLACDATIGAGPGAGPPLVGRNKAAGLAITLESCRSLGEGESYDLGMTIDVLIGAYGGRCLA